MPDKRTRNHSKLQSLLHDRLQFDHADLDFGIYRIEHEKRDEVERFIKHDLLDAAEEALARFEAGNQERNAGPYERRVASKDVEIGLRKDGPDWHWDARLAEESHPGPRVQSAR